LKGVAIVAGFGVPTASTSDAVDALACSGADRNPRA
jgi:hypothetical protein